MATPENTNEHARGINGAIAAELRAERAARKMSIPVLASRSGISPTSVQRYLAPTRAIDMTTLEALSDALGCTMREIVLRAEERRRREADSLDEQSRRDVTAGKSALDRAKRGTSVVNPQRPGTSTAKTKRDAG